MTEPASRKSRSPLFMFLLLCVLLLSLYQAVTWMVRRHVDQVIAEATGRTLPEIEMTDLSGARHSTREWNGKLTLLHLVRSHCESCLQERDAVLALERSLDPERQQIVSLIVDPMMGFSAEDSAATARLLGFHHPVWIAAPELLAVLHGPKWARVTPITYVIDEDGKVLAGLRGEQTVDSLRDALRIGTER